MVQGTNKANKELLFGVAAICILAILASVMIIAIDKFADAQRESTDVLAENVTLTAGAGQFLQTSNILTLDDCVQGNDSSVLTVGTYCNLSTLEGAISVQDNPSGDVADVRVNYTYDRATTVTDNLGDSSSAIGEVQIDWMSLLVTVMVTSIILIMLAGAFSYFGFSQFSRQ